MTYQAIDRIFYLLTGLSFALGIALALSFLLGWSGHTRRCLPPAWRNSVLRAKFMELVKLRALDCDAFHRSSTSQAW